MEFRDGETQQGPSLGSSLRVCFLGRGCRLGAGSRSQGDAERRDDCWGCWREKAGERGLGFLQPPTWGSPAWPWAWRGHSSSSLPSCYLAHGHTQAKQMEPLEGVFLGPIGPWSSFPVLSLDFFLIVVPRGKAWFVASRGAHCCFLPPCPAPRA